jgi:predicted glycosyltransferase
VRGQFQFAFWIAQHRKRSLHRNDKQNFYKPLPPLPNRFPAGEAMNGPRIALYSHDTMGLGHIRRNQLIAKVLAAPPLNASVLLITGIREGGAFAVPRGIDSMSLPAYHKGADGTYSARSLDMSAEQLRRLRADLIDMALMRFEPDLFIADNVPRGALDELMPALTRMRGEGRTRCVLGLREILDDPAIIRREWDDRKNFETIRSFYDAIWVYGDPAVYETATEYGFPGDVRNITSYMGYLDPCHGLDLPKASSGTNPKSKRPKSKRLALCSAGGGQDGFELAQNFARAAFPDNMTGLIVTGPFMPRDKRKLLTSFADARADLDVIEAIYDPIPLIRRADCVIAMAGYNTVNEILALDKRALLVPRTKPRTEQLIRAERLAELGLADLLPDTAVTPAALTHWLGNFSIRVAPRSCIDFGGLDCIVRHATAMMPAFETKEELLLAANG